ncbi:MAG: TraR/DksA C4-type zinc finger protein [Planctomycetota bacterium]
MAKKDKIATRTRPAVDKPARAAKSAVAGKVAVVAKPANAGKPVPAAKNPAPAGKSAAAPAKGSPVKLGTVKPGALKPGAAKVGAVKPAAAGAVPVSGATAGSKAVAAKLAKVGKSAKAGAGAPKLVASSKTSAADKAASRAAINAARGAIAARTALPPPKPPPKKSPYNRKALAPLRTALYVMRKRLAGDMDLMGKEALRADEPEVDAENVADHGSDAFERTMTLELMENEARMMRQIDEALDMMDTGRYGLCQECGQPIPLVRLEALPFAQTCVPCKETLERQR